MKYSQHILVVLSLIVLSNLTHAQHFIFYSSDEDGYSMKFPETWKRADQISGKLSLVALAPEETEAEDGVREQLHVAIFPLNGKKSDAFYSYFKASHEEKNRSWKLIEDGEISGRKTKSNYFSCYYSDTSTNRTTAEYVYIFFKGEKAFVLTCTTSFDESEEYKQLFNQIAGSFSFILEPEE